METPNPPIRQVAWWKRIAVVSFFSGLGAALVIATIIWYGSRPVPPRHWNTTALVAELPGFSISNDGKSLRLIYSVKNNTDVDYKFDENAAKQLRILIKLGKDDLTPPLENKGLKLEENGIFIPARQKGTIVLMLENSELPKKLANETDDDHHERLRKYLGNRYASLKGLVIFDEVNHYQIDLPKWADKKPSG